MNSLKNFIQQHQRTIIVSSVAVAVALFLLRTISITRNQKTQIEKGRFVIKFAKSCTIEQRIASKLLIAETLGGESAISAIYDGSQVLEELLVIDTKTKNPQKNPQQQQEKEEEEEEYETFDQNKTDVVAIVIIKEGVQDIQLRSEINHAETDLRKGNLEREQILEKFSSSCRILGKSKEQMKEAAELIVSTAERILKESKKVSEQEQKQMKLNSSSNNNDYVVPKAVTEPLQLLSAMIHSLAVSPAHTGKRLGICLGNVAAALVVKRFNCIEIQGNAADKSLVSYYRDKAAPPNLKPVENDQFFKLSLLIPIHREELLRRATSKYLPEYLELDEEVKRAFA